MKSADTLTRNFDPLLGVLTDSNLALKVDLVLQKSPEAFEHAIAHMGAYAVDACYTQEMADSARLSYLNLLRARRAQLKAALPHPCDSGRRIKDALGMALCHVQNGGIDKAAVVVAIKTAMSDVDTLFDPLPPAA